MVNDRFKVGDVVRVVHHFDHPLRPDPETDGTMSGCLDAVVADAVGTSGRDGDGRENAGYKLVWLGHGRAARALPGEEPGKLRRIETTHWCRESEAWWPEPCLEMVRKGPFWELPWNR